MRPELRTVGANLEPEDYAEFERVRKEKGLNKTDFLKKCIKDAIAIHDYTNMKDWHPTIDSAAFEGRTEGSESKDTYDLDQIPSRKAVKVTIHEKRVI